MTVQNAFRTVIMYSHYGQSLWTVIKTVLFFIMTVQNDCPFCEMRISSHKNVRPLFIVKSEFLGYNAFFIPEIGERSEMRDETDEAHFPVGHALLEDGEESGAGGDQSDPLRDDDGEEEAGVARVLQCLAVLIRPLLRRKIPFGLNMANFHCNFANDYE